MYLFPIFVENLFHFAYQLNFSPICSFIWNVVSGLSPFLAIVDLYTFLTSVCIYMLHVSVCISSRVLSFFILYYWCCAFFPWSLFIREIACWFVSSLHIYSCALFFTQHHCYQVVFAFYTETMRNGKEMVWEQRRAETKRVSEYFAIYPFSNEFVYNITNEQMPTEWDFFSSLSLSLCIFSFMLL